MTSRHIRTFCVVSFHLCYFNAFDLNNVLFETQNLLLFQNSIVLHPYECLAQIRFVINAPKQVTKPKGYVAALSTLILLIRS